MPAIRVDPSSQVPVFRQIVDGLRALLAAGVYRPGDLIPSVRQQAIALLVNPNTVQRAYEELERLGLIESRRGVGMVVVDGSQPSATRGAQDAIAAALATVVEQARAAGLSRERVDVLYGRAWGDTKRATAKGARR